MAETEVAGSISVVATSSLAFTSSACVPSNSVHVSIFAVLESIRSFTKRPEVTNLLFKIKLNTAPISTLFCVIESQSKVPSKSNPSKVES